MLTPHHTRMNITVKMNLHLHFHFAFEVTDLEHSHKRYTPWSVLQDGKKGFIYTQRNQPFNIEILMRSGIMPKQSHTYLHQALVETQTNTPMYSQSVIHDT
jgi:hypothetical protein